MKRNLTINESVQKSINESLKPLLEGVSPARVEAIKKFAEANAHMVMSNRINESFSSPLTPSQFVNNTSVSGAGDIRVPSLGNGVTAGAKGTGDTFGALSNLPIATKILRSTRFLDLVNTRPVTEPAGFLRYQDIFYTETGSTPYGNAGTASNPNPYNSYGKRDQGTTFYLHFQSKTAGAAGEKEKSELLRNLRAAVAEERAQYPTDASLVAAKATAKTIIEIVPSKLYVRILGVGRYNNALIVQEIVDPSVAVADAYTPELSLANIFGEFSGFYKADGLIDPTKLHATRDLTIATKTVEAVGINSVSAIDDPIAGYSSEGNFAPTYRDGAVVVRGRSRGAAEVATPRRLQAEYTSIAFKTKTITQAIQITMSEIEDYGGIYGNDIRKEREEMALNLMALEIDAEGLERLSQLGWLHAVQAFNSEDVNLNISFRAGATNTPALWVANLEPDMWDNPVQKVQLPYAQDTLPVKSAPQMLESGVTLAARLKVLLLRAVNLMRYRSKINDGEVFALMNADLVSLLVSTMNESLNPTPNNIQQKGATADYVGELWGIKIYRDQSLNLRDFRITMGIKSSNDKAPGVIFCPYIMGQVTRRDVTMTEELGSFIRSRYAIVNYGFYPQNSYFTFYFDPGF